MVASARRSANAWGCYAFKTRDAGNGLVIGAIEEDAGHASRKHEAIRLGRAAKAPRTGQDS